MKYISMVYSAASGSIGGVTYSHNRFGLYTRAKAIPVNPNTAIQQLARSRLALYAASWATLTQLQRDAWTGWAAVVSKVNSMGATIFLTGFNWYVAINTQRNQAGKTAAVLPSAVLALTTFQPITTTIQAAGNTATVSFNQADPWATAVGGFMNVFASLAVPATRTFLSGPFRKIATVSGAVIPPTTPQVIALGYDVQVGQRVFIRANVQDQFAAPSNAQIVTALAV